jgi:uncharacterized protein YkwD
MGAHSTTARGEARRSIFAAAVLLLLVAMGTQARAATTQTRAANQRMPQAEQSSLERSVFSLLNRERAKHGLGPLHRSTKLDRSSGWQSRDMVVHRYFEHHRRGGPSLVKRIRRTGYLRQARHWIVGENIAWAEGSATSPSAIVAGWMASPTHRSNILYKRFRNIGIGLVPGDPYGGVGQAVTVTTDFGVRMR